MRYVGIDYGAKRVGVAVSDEGGAMAFPHAILENDARLITDLLARIESLGAKFIVVGDALSYSGIRNPVTDDVDDFIDLLKKQTNLPVERSFEAGSSIEASRYAPEGESHNDSVAAAIILQRFLDSKRTS